MKMRGNLNGVRLQLNLSRLKIHEDVNFGLFDHNGMVASNYYLVGSGRGDYHQHVPRVYPHLQLRDCAIEKIEPEIWPYLEGLESLDLTDNQIRLVNNELFSPHLTRLRVLDLSGNPIGHIGVNAFQIPSLKFLGLADVPTVNRVDENAFNGLDGIHSLFLQHNQSDFKLQERLRRAAEEEKMKTAFAKMFFLNCHLDVYI